MPLTPKTPLFAIVFYDLGMGKFVFQDLAVKHFIV
jgi:hypothetical protein